MISTAGGSRLMAGTLLRTYAISSSAPYFGATQLSRNTHSADLPSQRQFARHCQILPHRRARGQGQQCRYHRNACRRAVLRCGPFRHVHVHFLGSLEEQSAIWPQSAQALAGYGVRNLLPTIPIAIHILSICMVSIAAERERVVRWWIEGD